MKRILVFTAGAILAVLLLETVLRLAGFIYRIKVKVPGLFFACK